MTRADAIRKIASLLKLAASSPSPHEAASATAAARRVMLSQGITEADMKSAEEVGAQYTCVDSGVRWPIEVVITSGILTDFFAVVIAQRSAPKRRRPSHRELHIVGLPHHVDMAVHVYKFLRATFRNHWTNARRALQLPACDRRAFMLAMGCGICDRLREDREACETKETAIEVSEARHSEWLSRQVTKRRSRNLSHITCRDENSVYVGYESGRRTSIRPALAQEAVA